MESRIHIRLKALLLVPLLLWQANVFAQQTITGKVIDSKTSEALPGVNILIKGTTSGTATTAKGIYTLQVPSLTDTLVFSYIGYETKTVPINGRMTVNVSLTQQTLTGQQMIVVGYGTQKKKDLTGAISTVSPSDLKKTVSPNIADALQGRIAGVTVQTSGDPGSAPNIKIRGPATFGNNQPLYVVDGVPVGGIQDFNPDDIQSIQVLKDASAAAIYGTRAANGVVIITTKKGSRGPVKVHYHSYYGVQNIVNRYKMMNSTQYQKLDNEEITNAIKAGNTTLTIAPANDPNSPNYVNPNKINTNWQNAAFKTAHVQDQDLTISGGDKNNTYAITGDYFNQGGTLSGPGPNFKRYSARLNSDHTFGKFEVTEHMYYAHWDKVNLTGLHLTSPIMDILHALPTQPIYDPSREGGYSGTNSNIRRAISLNVIGANNLLQSTTKVDRFLGDVTGQYNIMPNLYYKLRFSYDHSLVQGFNFRPLYDLGFFYQNTIAKLDQNENNYNTQLVENTLHYKKDLGKHHFTVVLGYTQQVTTFSTVAGHAEGYTKPYFPVLNAGTENKNTSGYKNRNTLRSFLGRVTYNYEDTYLLEGTFRRDGSSRFGPGNKYGFFPSVSAGWRISNEPFFQGLSFVNNLKLRASYGRLGNDDLGDYAYTAYINPYANYEFGNQLAQGSIQVSLANPNIRWETNISRDVGVDLGLFNDKVDLTVDYYNNIAKGVLFAVPIPATTGSITAPVVNAASLLNKGLEFSLEYANTLGGLHYDLSANLSTLKNKVLALGQGGKPVYGNMSKTAVGQPIGELYGYVAEGIFQNQNQINTSAPGSAGYDPNKHAYQEPGTAPGDIIYKDLNGDGVITSADRTYLGSVIPKFTYGFNANLNYRQWDLSLFFQGSYGNKLVNRVRQTVELMDGYGNYDQYVYYNHWTPQNHSTTVPRAIFGDPNNNGRDSQRWIEDGSYLRLQNLQIGYTLPSSFLGRIGVSKLRIYAQGQNVFTITKYKGYDPVINTVNASFEGPIGGGNDGLFSRGVDVGSYPQPRTLSLGISLDF